MAIRMIREPSETPNVNNIDDIVPFRYAYGNQNGYVIDKGNELSYTINGNEFRINSGRVVLDGVESDIDANGFTITVDNIAGIRYYTVYYRVNLATNTVSIENQYDSAGFPIIPKGDDLTENTSGIANLELYHFQANSGVISNVEKVVKDIVYSGTALRDYDISKGTIEERLTALGFREARANFNRVYVTPGGSRLKRQGNYVIFTFSGLIKPTGNNAVEFCSLPLEFTPKESFTFFEYYSDATIKIFYDKSSNLVYFYYNYASGHYVTFADIYFSVGYEAEPVE